MRCSACLRMTTERFILRSGTGAPHLLHLGVFQRCQDPQSPHFQSVERPLMVAIVLFRTLLRIIIIQPSYTV